jgi:hypothetical protein
VSTTGQRTASSTRGSASGACEAFATRSALRLLTSFDPIRQHFALKRHLLRASLYRNHLAARFAAWREFTNVTQTPSTAVCTNIDEVPEVDSALSSVLIGFRSGDVTCASLGTMRWQLPTGSSANVILIVVRHALLINLRLRQSIPLRRPTPSA